MEMCVAIPICSQHGARHESTHGAECVLQDAHSRFAPSRTQTLLTPVTGSSAPVPLAGSEKTPQVSRDVVPCMAWAEGNEAGMRVHRACG